MKKIRLRYIFIICVYITFKHAYAAVEISSTVNDKKLTPILEGWQNFENKVKYLTNSGVKLLVPAIRKEFADMNFSDECMENINHLISGMEEIKSWAMKFIDSSGKVFDGVLTGSFSSLGSYDECLNIELKKKDFNDEQLFRGQYCTIMMQPPLPPKPNYMEILQVPEELKNFSQRDTAVAELSRNIHFFYVTPLRLGICVPSGCNIHDVNKMAKLLGRELSLEATASRCETKENTKFTPSAIFAITLYSFVGFVVLVGTSIDTYSYYSKTVYKNTAIRVLQAFSFFTNFKKFSSASNTNDINCLHGIRFLGSVWVILCHEYILTNGLTHGLKEYDRLIQLFTFQFVVNGSLGVDTFIFISGMLVCYLTFKKYQHQKNKFNVLMYIIHRIWRILPSYFFVLMATFFMHMVGSGPMWHDMLDPTLDSCRKHWWYHVLFIQNFYEADVCFIHFWYVAVDFQLYILALVILLPILRWPKIGVSLAFLAIIASAFYAGIVTYIHKLPPTILFTVEDIPTIINLAFKRYFKPFTHVGPYVIGLLSGYLLATRPKMKMPPFVLVMGWSLAFVLSFSVLHGALPWYRGEDTPLAATIAYVSLHRIVWILGVAWVIICCATGNGGIVNYILSLRVFVQLGRLSYLAYLIHFPLQFVFIGNIRTRVQIDPFFKTWMFCGDVAVSFALAFLVNMLVEVPFANLEKICFSNRGKRGENLKITKEHDTMTMDVKSEKKGDINGESGTIIAIPFNNIYADIKLENKEHLTRL